MSGNVTTQTTTSIRNSSNNTITVTLKANNDTENVNSISQENRNDEYSYEVVYLDSCEFIPNEMAIVHLCTCGDLFVFKVEELRKGNNRTECPSCSLIAMLQFKPNELEEFIKNHKD